MSGFTNWLRKSGIKYQYRELAGTEMIDDLNPFDPLYNGYQASDFVERPAWRVFFWVIYDTHKSLQLDNG